MNRNLYLRKNPRSNKDVLSDEFDKDMLKELIYDKSFCLSEEHCEQLVAEIINYDKAKAIYQLIITSKGMFLKQRTDIGDYLNNIIPVTEEELELNYVSLSTFFKESEYIGRRGRMTSLSENGSDMFINKRNPIVLYASKTHMILYNAETIYRGKTPIEILDYRYCTNWEYFGEQNDVYSNSNILYHDLLLDSLPQRKVLKRTFPTINKK